MNKHLLETGGLFRRIGSAIPRIFKNTARVLSPGVDRLTQSTDPSSWSEIEGPTDTTPVGGVIPRHPIPFARVYSRNIIKMRIIAAAFGSKFVCAMQPDQQSIPDGGKQDWLAQAYAAFRVGARKYLSSHGVVHIDLNEFDGFQQSMFMDRMHLDALGNQAMAAMLLKTIQEHDLLSRK